MTGKIRTDLAVEQHENLGSGELQGVRADAYETRGYEIERVDILDERGAESLCKPIGSYLTISARALTERRQDSFQNGAETLAGLIRSLLPQPGGLTLVENNGYSGIYNTFFGRADTRFVCQRYGGCLLYTSRCV